MWTSFRFDLFRPTAVGFRQVAWENLEVARVVTEKRCEEIVRAPEFEKAELEKLMRQRARVHIRLGDLECWKENFEEGLGEYRKALELRMKFEDPRMSRDISEMYL